MKWRCEWCGKPQAADDPPCDNCGHGSFEEAVVQVPDYETVDTGPDYVWACTECGREHVRNSPPCARCGNPTLERSEQDYDDVTADLDVPSWFEVARPYAPVIVVLALVVGLFATGVVPLSVLPGVGPTVPGEGSAADGIDLVELEGAVHDGLASERRADPAGDENRTLDADLSTLATYYNHRHAVDRYGDGDPDDVSPPGSVDPACTGEPTGWLLDPLPESVEQYEDEAELTDAVVTALLESEFAESVISGYEAEGLDVHVGPDGTVHVVYTAC